MCLSLILLFKRYGQKYLFILSFILSTQLFWLSLSCTLCCFLRLYVHSIYAWDASWDLIIFCRGFLTPYFMKTPLYFLPPFFKIWPSPPSSPLSYTHTPQYTVTCCLVSLTEWMIMPHLMCNFTLWHYGSTHGDPWYFSTTTALYVLCNKALSDWYGKSQCCFLPVPWFDIIHTNLLIRFNKNRFFTWSTKNTDTYGVNKQNKNHHLHCQR